MRYGQSLSVGSAGYCGSTGYPACSSGAAYGNLTLFAPNSVYPPADTQLRTLAGHTYQNSPPAIESSATSMCNQYAAFSGRVCATADYGWPGVSYTSLKMGSSFCTSASNCFFDNSIGNGLAAAHTGVMQAKALANAQGSALYVPGVYYNQGESEMNGSVAAATYEGYMVQLQADYQTAIHAAIGQSGLIPLFLTQKSSWATWAPTRSTPTTTGGGDGVPIGQLQACLDHYADGKIFCVGPDYAHAYGLEVHRPANDYREQGGSEGKALYQVTVQKMGWRPFHPRSVTIAGNVITVQFWVPVGALRVDTTHVAALPDGNMGFEFTATGGSSVTMPNNAAALKAGTTDAVTIALSRVPAGTFELRYAWTSPNGACPANCSTSGGNYTGPYNGPRGNVADSDDRVWWAGDSLVDYALTFRIANISAAVPYSWAPADPDLTSIAGNPGSNGGATVLGKAGMSGKAAVR